MRHSALEFEVILTFCSLGVVGLAIARLLSLHYPEKSTFLVERNERAGEETRFVETPNFTNWDDLY